MRNADYDPRPPVWKAAASRRKMLSMTTSPAMPHAPTTTGLYARVLGDDWERVAEAVRNAHSDGRPLTRAGTFQVVRGPGRIATFLAAIARLPPSCPAAATVLVIEPQGNGGERWLRSFAGQ